MRLPPRGALNRRSVDVLTAKIVCGAANNQLAEPGIADLLERRAILYAPDYLVNAGGLIHVADEIAGFEAGRVRARVARIYDTARQVFAQAAAEGVSPAAAADRLAEQRIAAVHNGALAGA